MSSSLSLFPNFLFFNRNHGPEIINAQPPAINNRPETVDSDAATYHQGAQSIEETTAYINQHGAEIQKLYLTLADTALMKLIAERCPNLTALSIGYDSLRVITDFSHGFDYIPQIPNLKELNILFQFTYDFIKELAKLLNNETLQNNLTTLSLMFPNIFEEGLKGLFAFKKLQVCNLNFSIYYDEIFHKGLTTWASKETLTSLNLNFANSISLYGPTGLKEEDLTAFCDYPQLTNLSVVFRDTADYYYYTPEIAGDATASLLAARSFKEFNLYQCRMPEDINSDVYRQLSQQTTLEKLSIGECDNIPAEGYDIIFNLNSITTLNLQHAYNLQSKTLEKLKYRPVPVKNPSELRKNGLEHNPLKSLTLSGYNAQGDKNDFIKKLCSIPAIQQELEHLFLIDDKCTPPAAFTPLANLKNVQTIRILNCSHFNDEPFKALTDSRGPHSHDVELVNASLTDEQIDRIGKLNPKNIIVGPCNALTSYGIVQLIKGLQNAQKIYLNGIVIDNDALNCLKTTPFPNLNLLILGLGPQAYDSHHDKIFDELSTLPQFKDKVQISVEEELPLQFNYEDAYFFDNIVTTRDTANTDYRQHYLE